MSGNEAAVRIDRRSLVDHCSSRFLLEKLPLGRTEHHWDPYIRHGYGKERKGYGSVCVDQMLARGEGKTRPFDTKFCMFLFFFQKDKKPQCCIGAWCFSITRRVGLLYHRKKNEKRERERCINTAATCITPHT